MKKIFIITLMIVLGGMSFSMERKSEIKGIPTMGQVDHVGITVPDMDEAIGFITHIIGGELLFRGIGPFSFDEGEWMIENLDVHPRAVLKELALIKVKNGALIELFTYDSPDQNKNMVKNSDMGGNHIAFYVEDMDRAVEYLKDKGVIFQGEPKHQTEGINRGLTWVYFTAPWGAQMELVSYPKGWPMINMKK